MIVQIAVAAIILPLLLSALVHYLWPSAWLFFVHDVLRCPTRLDREEKEEERKREQIMKDRHGPHYVSPEKSSFCSDSSRVSRSKMERKIRVENPKRRAQSAAEEQQARESERITRLKAQATRVEKHHRLSEDRKGKKPKNTSNFKYPFREESLSTETNPYLSMESTPVNSDPDRMKLSVESKDTSDIESGESTPKSVYNAINKQMTM